MFRITIVLAVVATVWQQGEALPIEVVESPLGQTENFTDYLAYLRKYEYLQESSKLSDTRLRVIDIETGIRRLQLYGNIPQTGLFDEATIALMKRPRCGVPDPVGVSDETRDALGGSLQKRYAHTGGRWESNSISYRILNSAGSGLTVAESNDAIRRAFLIWEAVTPLRFTEVSSGFADIYLKFGPGYHGDPYPFDGFGGTLAHAYPPMSGFGDLDGDVHFDDAEPYTVYTDLGINLYIVAAHEIGHSLGLAHSTDTRALMAPFYQGYKPEYRLPDDDRIGIQTIYGGPESSATTKPPVPGATVKPGATTKPGATVKPADGCLSLTFTGIGYIRGELFAFQGPNYWRVRTPGQLITSIKGDETAYFFYNLPDSIDASYERYHDQRIIFFKGDQYWEYDGLNVVTGFPKPIKDLDASLPSNVDAILTYNEYLKTYFFKGNQVWRYDEGAQRVDDGWPYDIDYIFPGIPSDLHAAFRYKDGIPIFVKGPQYYMYNDATASVDPGYPRSFGEDFLGCEPDKLENGSTARTPTLLGVVLGSLIMILNQLC